MELTDETCPNCGAKLVKRKNKYGNYFLSCSRFPKCRFTKSLEESSISDQPKVLCPKCGKGFLVPKKNKKGQIFYGCSDWRNSKCDFTLTEQQFKKEYVQEFTDLSGDSPL